jgi:hypothetical protein
MGRGGDRRRAAGSCEDAEAVIRRETMVRKYKSRVSSAAFAATFRNQSWAGVQARRVRGVVRRANHTPTKHQTACGSLPDCL